MKKIFTLLSAFAVCFSSLATTFTFSDDASAVQTIDGISVKIEKASSNNEPKSYNDHLRLYAGNTITVSGADLTKISISFSKQGSKEYAALSASAGSLVSGGVSSSNDDLKTDVWTGSTRSVTFTLGSSGQRIIYSMTVNGTEGEGGGDNPGGGDPSEPDTPSELDPDFTYPEPTIVTVPDITVQGAQYSFISNNILVECTKGAVTDTYFSAHADFALTFTAVKPIKGIVINGFVKKGFEADVDHGTVSYLTPDEDVEANPVMVITDIDSPKVTIDCVKQLRCYSVEIYFDANPEATVSGGNTGGETINLLYDSAEAVYESEYSEVLGEYNYSVFLFNAASPDVPYFALDLYPESKDDITGTYTYSDWSLGDYSYYVYGAGEDDYTWVDDGSVTISRDGDVYTVTGTFLCDNGNTYNVSFTGQMPFYLDTDYYGDGGSSAVGEIISEPLSDGDSRMYDLQGHPVGKDYRGIYIRNGKKYINR